MKKGSIFELNGIPRLQEACPLALQHVVAMIVGCVTPAIIVAGAVGGGGLNAEDRVILIQASLVMSAILHTDPALSHRKKRRGLPSVPDFP